MKKNNFFKEKNIWSSAYHKFQWCFYHKMLMKLKNKRKYKGNNCEYPFVVGKIEYYNEKMSTYYTSYNGDGSNIIKSRIILPSKMFNIGDTIRPVVFFNDTIK